LRIFAIGVGTGASEELLVGVAEKGNGRAIFLEDNKDINN